MSSNQLVSATEIVDIDSLSTHPDNPRRGDTAVIAESLLQHGQYRPIVVQQSTRRILAGNHTWAAARELGWETIAVVWVDVDDDTARRILVADNRTAELASWDEPALVALLQQFDSLDGLGYSAEAFADLVAKTTGPPDLDELAESLGDTTPEDFWPTLRFKIPPLLHKRYLALVEGIAEGERFAWLVEAAER